MKWFVLAGEAAGEENASAEGIEKVTKWLGNPEGSSGGAGWSDYHKQLQIFTAAAEAVKKHPLWQGELKQEPMVTTFPGLALTVFLFKSEAGNRTFTAFEATGYEGVVVKQKEVEGGELATSAETSSTSEPELAQPHQATETIAQSNAETQPETETASTTQPQAEMAAPEAETKVEPEEKKTEDTSPEGEDPKSTPVAVQPQG